MTRFYDKLGVVVFDRSSTTDQRREILRERLSTGVTVVTFTKVDGTVRDMPCTLDASIIPSTPVHVSNTDNPVDFSKTKKEKKPNPGVMSVWCVDKSGWRSFKIDNVLEICKINS